jgi:hypothetical protein
VQKKSILADNVGQQLQGDFVQDHTRGFVFRHRRCRTELPLIVSVKRRGAQVDMLGQCLELSESGLLAAVEGHLENDEHVMLQLHAPGEETPMTLHATTHCRSIARYAFRFSDDNDAIKVERLIERIFRK